MGLTYKGVEPDEITYDGQPVDSVTYNGVEVWSGTDFECLTVELSLQPNLLYNTPKYIIYYTLGSTGLVYIYNKSTGITITKSKNDFNLQEITAPYTSGSANIDLAYCPGYRMLYRYADGGASHQTLCLKLNEETLTEEIYDEINITGTRTSISAGGFDTNLVLLSSAIVLANTYDFWLYNISTKVLTSVTLPNKIINGSNLSAGNTSAHVTKNSPVILEIAAGQNQYILRNYVNYNEMSAPETIDKNKYVTSVDFVNDELTFDFSDISSVNGYYPSWYIKSRKKLITAIDNSKFAKDKYSFDNGVFDVLLSGDAKITPPLTSDYIPNPNRGYGEAGWVMRRSSASEYANKWFILW